MKKTEEFFPTLHVFLIFKSMIKKSIYKSCLIFATFLSFSCVVSKVDEPESLANFNYQTAISLERPLAINLSLGTNDGGHDGFSLFETYIDDMANRWLTSIIVAAGNQGNARSHAQAPDMPCEGIVANHTPECNFQMNHANCAPFISIPSSNSNLSL